MQEPNEVVEIEPAFAVREREIKTTNGSARVAVLVCEPLEQAGFVNAFSTRLGGVSPLPSNSLNLADFKGDQKENVSEKSPALSGSNRSWTISAVYGATDPFDRTLYYRVGGSTRVGLVLSAMR